MEVHMIYIPFIKNKKYEVIFSPSFTKAFEDPNIIPCFEIVNPYGEEARSTSRLSSLLKSLPNDKRFFCGIRRYKAFKEEYSSKEAFLNMVSDKQKYLDETINLTKISPLLIPYLDLSANDLTNEAVQFIKICHNKRQTCGLFVIDFTNENTEAISTLSKDDFIFVNIGNAFLNTKIPLLESIQEQTQATIIPVRENRQKNLSTSNFTDGGETSSIKPDLENELFQSSFTVFGDFLGQRNDATTHLPNAAFGKLSRICIFYRKQESKYLVFKESKPMSKHDLVTLKSKILDNKPLLDPKDEYEIYNTIASYIQPNKNLALGQANVISEIYYIYQMKRWMH
jgi:hypothetical protein